MRNDQARTAIRLILAAALGLSAGATAMTAFVGMTLGVFLVALAGLCVWSLALGLWLVSYGMGWLD